MMRMIKNLAARSLFGAVLITGAVLTPPGAMADSAYDYLEGFTGTWRGTGAVRIKDDSDPEKIVCKIDGNIDGSGQELVLAGRCGGERFTGTFKISLTYNRAAKSYTAIWRDSLGSKSPPLTGLKNGNKLIFRVKHNDFETKGRAISTLIIDTQASRFRITGRTTPEATKNDFVSADLVFTKS